MTYGGPNPSPRPMPPRPSSRPGRVPRPRGSHGCARCSMSNRQTRRPRTTCASPTSRSAGPTTQATAPSPESLQRGSSCAAIAPAPTCGRARSASSRPGRRARSGGPSTPAERAAYEALADVRKRGGNVRGSARRRAASAAGLARLPVPPRTGPPAPAGVGGRPDDRRRACPPHITSWPRGSPTSCGRACRTQSCGASPRRALRTPAVSSARCGACCRIRKPHTLVEEFGGQWLQIRALESGGPTRTIPGLRRLPASVDAARDRALLHQHRPRRPQHPRLPRRAVDVHERAAGAPLRHRGRHGTGVPARGRDRHAARAGC